MPGCLLLLLVIATNALGGMSQCLSLCISDLFQGLLELTLCNQQLCHGFRSKLVKAIGIIHHCRITTLANIGDYARYGTAYFISHQHLAMQVLAQLSIEIRGGGSESGYCEGFRSHGSSNLFTD